MNESESKITSGSSVLTDEIHVKPELVISILDTIRFFDLFDFPLAIDEVRDYLYKYFQPLHIKELRGTLDHLVNNHHLMLIKDFYVLPGRESIIEARKGRKFIAEKYWNRVKLYGQYMRQVPFTRMIAVCNNLAYDNPNQDSDIDLFIVVKPGRMWLCRLFITIILQFFGVRRHGEKIAGRFCLSFFVTENNLTLKPFELSPEDPYLAYWTKTLRPVFGEEVYTRFCQENRNWLAEYGLNFDESRKKHMYLFCEGILKRLMEWLLGGWIGDQLENFLKITLKRKSLRSMKRLGPTANVVVSDDVLKFHNHDRRQEYFDLWKKNQ